MIILDNQATEYLTINVSPKSIFRVENKDYENRYKRF